MQRPRLTAKVVDSLSWVAVHAAAIYESDPDAWPGLPRGIEYLDDLVAWYKLTHKKDRHSAPAP